jgi:hypothetical protein
MVLKLGHLGKQIRNNWEVWKVMLEKDGGDELDRSRDKWLSITYSQGGEKYSTQ